MSHPVAEEDGVRAPVDLVSLPPHEGPVGSVYVHAPFCARRCFYCDFAVDVRRSGGAGVWLEALTGELRAVEEEGRFPLANRLDTLYVGGGTPSVLRPDAMDGLAAVLGRDRLRAPRLEWTAEANPEDLAPELARAWRSAGVTRVSLGVQSFQDPALRWLGRLHDAEAARRVASTARDAGIEEISVDLVFGLPPRLERSWPEDLARVVDLGVPHVSLYGLTAEDDTPLGRAVAAGRERLAPESRYREEFLHAAEYLTASGYHHYEVSNFALPGHLSEHNRVYWEGRAYLGLGNSAHSYRHPVRRWNLASWNAYQEVALETRMPVQEEELLDAAAHRLERVWLGLRTRRGLSMGALGSDARDLARRWVADGLATDDGGALRLTAEGWLIVDRLAATLDVALSPTTGRGAIGTDPGRPTSA